MKAWIIERAGGPEVLRLADIPAPQTEADEVKIRIRAFGLNRAEVYRRTGMMGPIDSPVVPGIEAVGEVISDASGTFRTGQRVATAMGGMQVSRPGSYAEEVVRGGTAALGLAAIAYAKSLGAKVVATTRSEGNVGRLREMGADVAIVDRGRIEEDVRRAFPEGVDAALEVVGAATLRDTIKALKPFGGVAVVGLLGGPPVLEGFNLMQDLPSATRLSFFPSGLLGTAALPLTGAPLTAIAEGVSAGRIPSLRARSFDFGDVRQAHALMESDRALGKLVIRL